MQNASLFSYEIYFFFLEEQIIKLIEREIKIGH